MLTLAAAGDRGRLVFEFINGFHDTANSIATVVATKVLTPMQAVGLAASMNLIGALAGARRWPRPSPAAWSTPMW
jgi:PiT family inorganic phosphate transporter